MKVQINPHGRCGMSLGSLTPGMTFIGDYHDLNEIRSGNERYSVYMVMDNYKYLNYPGGGKIPVVNLSTGKLSCKGEDSTVYVIESELSINL